MTQSRTLQSFASVALMIALAICAPACTAIGAGTGAVVGAVRQPASPSPPPGQPSTITIIPTSRDAYGVQREDEPPMSIGQHAAVGAGLGLAIDVATVVLLGLALSNADFECEGVAHC